MLFLENPSDLKDWKREVLRTVRGHLDRREFLRAAMVGAAALLGPTFGGAGRRGQALAGLGRDAGAPTPVKTGTFYFPRLMFHVKDHTGDQWNTDPIGDINLRRRLAELTNINVSQSPVVVKLSDLEKMVRYPFVFATSEGYFDLPPLEERNLKEFLARGGFVLADDCVVGKTGDRFFQDYRKMVQRLFPEHDVRKVPNDHELYNCYFEFPKGAVHLQGKKHGDWGLFEKGTGRIMTLIVPGDIHCGWCFMFFTKPQNEAAIRMGINIIIYYLTH